VVATVDVAWAQIWQKLKASSVKSVDIGIADFSFQRVVAEKEVYAVDILSCL